MKSLKLRLWGLLILITAVSCQNDELSPIITFESATKGAYVRLLEESPRELDLANFSYARYDYTIEFVDLEQGALIDQYEIYVSFVDNNPDNGDASSGPVEVESFDTGDFFVNARGFVGLSVTLTLNELSDALDLVAADILALDKFKIESSITTSDGRSFMASNSSPTVNGSSFQGHFTFTLLATCPLPKDWFTGEYNLEYLMPGLCGWGCSITDSIVNLKPVADRSTQRQFDVRFLEIFGGWDVLIKIDIQCDIVVILTTDTGIGCGDNIMLRPGAPQPIDISDREAVIVFEFIEDTGDCIAGTPLWQIQLTPVN